MLLFTAVFVQFEVFIDIIFAVLQFVIGPHVPPAQLGLIII